MGVFLKLLQRQGALHAVSDESHKTGVVHELAVPLEVLLKLTAAAAPHSRHQRFLRYRRIVEKR